MKFKYLIILIAIGSLLVLYLLSLVSHPALVPLLEVPAHNGQHVMVQGVVTDYRTITYGSQLVTIRDIENSTHMITLYIEGNVPVDYGDFIQVDGEVHQYKGQWEIVINSPQSVILLQRKDNQSTPLWYLAEHPETYLDTSVTVTGLVTQKHTESCVLTDQTNTYTLHVSYDLRYPHQFTNGDTVTVTGRFLYEPTMLHYILKTTENTHGIWKIDGYQND